MTFDWGAIKWISKEVFKPLKKRYVYFIAVFSLPVWAFPCEASRRTSIVILISWRCPLLLQDVSSFNWRRRWQPTPVLLPGKSHGRRSLVSCSPWGCEESETTEWLHFHFSLSCTGEGNGNPFQSSCLENPRDGGAWWAAVYGVAQSRTRLKWLGSSILLHSLFSTLIM